MQAKLGRRGSFTLRDDRALPVLLLPFVVGGGVEVEVGLLVGGVVGMVVLFTGTDAQLDGLEFDVGYGGRGIGPGSGTFRPMAVNGGPLSPNANGFFVTSSDGVALRFIISALRFEKEES